MTRDILLYKKIVYVEKMWIVIKKLPIFLHFHIMWTAHGYMFTKNQISKIFKLDRKNQNPNESQLFLDRTTISLDNQNFKQKSSPMHSLHHELAFNLTFL